MSTSVRVFLLILAIPGGALIRGWVISKTWEWFIVPITNFHPLSIAAGYGLAVFISALTYSQTDIHAMREGEKHDTQLTDSITSMIVAVVLVGIGWLVKTWWL